MISETWRRHRLQALFTVACLALLAVVLIPSGVAMHRSYVDTGLAACLDRLGTAEFVPLADVDSCGDALQAFRNAHGGVRALVMFTARPLFLHPKEHSFPVAGREIPNPAVGDWVLSRHIVDTGRHGRWNVLIYQPGERFWLFQYIETGLYVALAAVLLAVALRLIRRRIT